MRSSEFQLEMLVLPQHVDATKFESISIDSITMNVEVMVLNDLYGRIPMIDHGSCNYIPIVICFECRLILKSIPID